MLNVTEKQFSLRRARAEGYVYCEPEVVQRINNNQLPKGNLFDVARAAALLGAKQTPYLIPHCHPVPLEELTIEFTTNEEGVRIECSGAAIARTGLEMEVLTAVSVAALTIYDLLKPLQSRLEIGAIRLLEKKGGRSQFNKKYLRKGLQAAVLVASDSTAAGKRKDKSGQIIQELLRECEVEINDYTVLPDEPQAIQEQILEWVARGVDFIFTTGGTGLGPRDQTVEAVKGILEREAPGISEAMRSHGQQRTPVAMLSRGVSGVIKNSVVVTLPGSSNGARESLQAILPAVLHARSMLAGEGHD